jgi:hypothetical protein
MPRPGRDAKTRIAVTPKYCIGIENNCYTVEEFSTSQGWRPIKWCDSILGAAHCLEDLTTRATLVTTLGEGISKINAECIQLLLKEVDADTRRIYLATIAWLRGDDDLTPMP